MKTSKDWGLTGDSALIFDMLANWQPCDVETLPFKHTRGIDKGGKQFTITPREFFDGLRIDTRGYVVTQGEKRLQSPVLTESSMVNWVKCLKLS